MKQTHEEAEDLANRNRGSGVWMWVVAILAAVGVVGAVLLAVATMPLDFAPTKTMTER